MAREGRAAGIPDATGYAAASATIDRDEADAGSGPAEAPVGVPPAHEGAHMSDDAQAKSDEIVTAALLVIGDEILSGRTKDKNVGHIADHLAAIGIQLKEVRIVPDEEAEIVAAVNALRARYTYLFTTGGIGPTHDDIT
ncbi:MAG TPA: molybdopterin-binding protein, partial [Hyphomicrobiaceae bacterium]